MTNRDSAGRWASTGSANPSSIAPAAPLSTKVNDFGLSNGVKPPELTDLAEKFGRKGGASGSHPASGTAPAALLGNLAGMTTAVIQSAKRKKLGNAENARQARQKSTLDSYTDQAASQASEAAVRYGVLGNDGKPAMSTRDTRNGKTMAATGQPLDIGPEGSFGEPAGFLGRLPSTFDPMAGYL